MSSILDRKQLDIDNFEGAIAVGTRPQQLLNMFQKTGKEMDEWCGENYGIPNFHTVYDMVRQACYVDFMQCVKDLGVAGNPSALKIISDAINEHNEADSIVKIVFENNMKLEGEEDK